MTYSNYVSPGENYEIVEKCIERQLLIAIKDQIRTSGGYMIGRIGSHKSYGTLDEGIASDYGLQLECVRADADEFTLRFNTSGYIRKVLLDYKIEPFFDAEIENTTGDNFNTFDDLEEFLDNFWRVNIYYMNQNAEPQVIKFSEDFDEAAFMQKMI
jgi:hypothetical protein